MSLYNKRRCSEERFDVAGGSLALEATPNTNTLMVTCLSPESFREIVSGRRRDPLARLARAALRVAEPAYRAAVGWRNYRFDQGHDVQRVSVPVVSVGNLTLGGTGKSPMVAWLANWFEAHGVRVCLVSRGYGTAAGSENDEARELRQKLPHTPHLQDPNRVAAARRAIDEQQAQLVLLDDAFQHRRLARDLDLVLIDATEPFGFGHLLPRGMLREPPTSLARADLIILTRCNLVSPAQLAELAAEVHRLAPGKPLVTVTQHAGHLLDQHGAKQPLETLPEGPLLLFSGIGNPLGFLKLVQSLGRPIEAERVFTDHYAYPPEAIEQLERWAAAHPAAAAVVCTHKDLVKLPRQQLGGLPLWAIGLEIRITSGLDALETRLQALRELATAVLD